jgi:hypothetical protein
VRSASRRSQAPIKRGPSPLPPKRNTARTTTGTSSSTTSSTSTTPVIYHYPRLHHPRERWHHAEIYHYPRLHHPREWRHHAEVYHDPRLHHPRERWHHAGIELPPSGLDSHGGDHRWGENKLTRGLDVKTPRRGIPLLSTDRAGQSCDAETRIEPPSCDVGGTEAEPARGSSLGAATRVGQGSR